MLFLRLGAAIEGGTFALRHHRGRRRAAFTLVEVIVVLVILAILAAIAIPALTGYIKKAEDKKYISAARNFSVAMRTVINEAWASGEISDGIGNATEALKTFQNGMNSGDNATTFFIKQLSYYDADNSDYDGNHWHTYNNRAVALLGDKQTALFGDNLNSADYYTVALRGSGATAATADGFIFICHPEGLVVEKPMIVVTYKLERIESLAVDNKRIWRSTLTGQLTYGNGAGGLDHYDPDAGYEIYRLIMSGT